METNKVNISDQFQQQVFNYIKDHHPELLGNKEKLMEIIVEKANRAQISYSEAIREGATHFEAMEDANKMLHAGLEFSPIEYIQETFSQKGTEISEADAIKVYQKEKKFIDQQGMSDNNK